MSQVQQRSGEKELESSESGSMYLGEHTGEKGLSSSPKFKKRSGARSAGGGGHSPLTCGEQQESDIEEGGVSASWHCLRIRDMHCFFVETYSIIIFLSQKGVKRSVSSSTPTDGSRCSRGQSPPDHAR